MPISPTGFATPLHLEPGRSWPLTGVLLAAHLCVLASLLVPGLPVALRMLLALLVTLSLLDSVARHAWLRHPAALRRLVWRRDDWLLELADGRRLVARLGADSACLGPLVVLSFRAGTARHSCILLPHRLPPTTYRRLRVRLRIQARLAGGR